MDHSTELHSLQVLLSKVELSFCHFKLNLKFGLPDDFIDCL